MLVSDRRDERRVSPARVNSRNAGGWSKAILQISGATSENPVRRADRERRFDVAKLELQVNYNVRF